MEPLDCLAAPVDGGVEVSVPGLGVGVVAPVVVLLAAVNEFDGLPVYGVLARSPWK